MASVKRALELFTRLSLGDTHGYGAVKNMEFDILKQLDKAGASLAALDPTGTKSAKDMRLELNGAMANAQAKIELRAKYAPGPKQGRHI